MEVVKISEAQLQSAIIDYLQVLENQGKLMFERTNNTPIYDPTNRGFRVMPKGSKLGSSDIKILLKGIPIYIEVKQPGKYKRNGKVHKKGDYKYIQSEHQVKYQKLVEKNNGFYYVVRSVDEVLEILVNFGVNVK